MFDFLGNLYNKATSAVSSLFSNTASYTAPATPAANSSPAQTSTPINYTPYAAPQTAAPNMSTNLGPARGNNNGTITYNTPQGATTVPNSSISMNSTPAITGVTTQKPVVAPAVQSTQSSYPVTRQATTQTSSAPQYTAKPGTVAWYTERGLSAPRGEAGVSGSGSFSAISGTNSGSTPAIGAAGSGGFSVGAGPLGGYNAALGGVTPSDPNNPESKAYSNLKYNPATGKVEPVLNPDGSPAAPTGDMSGFFPKPTIGKMDTTTAMSTPSMTTPSDRYVHSPIAPTLSAPTIPQTLDAGNLSKMATDSQAHAIYSGSKSTDDLATITTNAKKAIDAGVANILANKGITPEKTLVQDTPEQTDFFKGLDPQQAFDYQKFADNFRTQNGMSDWLKLKESGLAAVQTATTFYNDLIKEVNANPDLPKGVASARVKAFIDQRDGILNKAKADMTMAENAISDINSSLNSQLGIVQAQRSEADRTRQINLDVLKTLISSGAEFSDADKTQWAKTLGLSVGTLDGLVSKTQKAQDPYITTDNGVTKAIDKSTGKTIWSNGTAKASTAATTPKTLDERTQQAVAGYSSFLQPGKLTPSKLTIINPDGGYINPAAWKELIAGAPSDGLSRESFIKSFGSYLYIDPKTNKPSPSYGLTPKEISDLGY